jgi:hypothetical protein
VTAATAFIGGSAFASSVNSASFSGGAGTAVVGGTLYAKAGASLTLTVSTSSDTQCVDVSGAFTAHQESGAPKSSWTFPGLPAPTGNGPQTVTITAQPNVNGQHKCTGTSGTGSASYTLDNTAPSVTGVVSPVPNGAGWNKSDATITWSASDGGSGVASGPTPATDSVTTETGSVTKQATATDRVGNTGSGSVVVKLDRTAPTITHTLTPAPTSFGWNKSDVTVAFNCSDVLSGIKSCPGGTTVTAAGPTPVSGTATDIADNSASDSATVKIDRTPPTLTGAAMTSPNANGWYSGDVTIHWSGLDNAGLDGSGVDLSTLPVDSVITGEGAGLTANAGPIKDQAGNASTIATSPAVNIDRHAPVTTATAPTTLWNNQNVTVVLSPFDALSGVDKTFYSVDGGAPQIGTNIVLNTDGQHTINFWSVDKAGNTESTKTVNVNIDKTPPTITHSQTPAANANGWNKTNVTVTFSCADNLSGIKSCTFPQTVSSEGKNQPVTGTAVDNADNSTTDPATVSIDKTKPTVLAAPDRLANAFGWYSAPVVVKFTCSDTLSGVATCASDRTLGEGASQSASGTGTDAADNSDSASVSGLNVDTTPPTLTGAPTTSPNANGWYNGDVTVHWTASDALSGIDPATVPGDSVVTGEGDSLSAGASVSDKAGNSKSATVGGLRIDRSAPATSATPGRAPDFNGWYAGPVKVSLDATDGLSGVDASYYSVDGGAGQPYSAPFDFGQGGIHTIRFWSVDKAGNVEGHGDDAHALTLKLDDIKPSISGTRVPNANAFGWNNGPVSVLFNCSDNETGIASCPAAVQLSSEGAGQSVTRTATDRAGNSADATVDGINIDLTPPTLSGQATTDPNANGWYNGDVTVHWTASDALSGIDPATVPDDSVVTGEGDNLSTPVVHAQDKAGNDTGASVNGIHIDRTPPNTTAYVPDTFNGTGWYAGPVQVSLLANDALSGVEATYYSVDGGDSQPYDGSFQFTEGGIHTITFWSVDKAGNVEDKTAGGNSITLKIDNINPTIDGTRSPDANAFGWNNGPVSVAFSCSDAETGIKSCVGDKTLSDEGAAQSVTGVATDNAGNKASATVDDINIDLTKPTLSGAPTTAPNAAGWYNGDVTVHWTGDDALSGVNDATLPADSTITGEGSDLGAGPVTVKDKAGNESDPASVSGIKIDRTPPKITGAPTTSPNANGWYSGPVAIKFDCTDELSGVATCPSEQVLSGDGADQSVTSAPAFDNAGNRADGATVGGINIDGTPPASKATLECTSQNGWCKGSTATVHISATDGLSGVAAIHYSVDGGSDQVAIGDSTAVQVPLSGTGKASVSYYAVDNADNAEAPNSAEVKWDNLAPVVTHTLNPPANAAGWDQVDTTVHFSAVDELGGSGVAFVTPDVLVDQETAGLLVQGHADDVAGNTGTDAITVKLDKTPPTISGAPTTPANPHGWYRNDVTVHFTCDDALSKVAVCPDDVTLTGEGAGQSVTRGAKDTADNTAETTVGGIDIDRTKPELSGAPTTDPNANGWYKGDVTVHWTASDDLSGIDPATTPADSVITGEGDDLGASASVSDKAGNSQSASVAGIKIDRTDPQTTISLPDPLPSGWYADKVPVTLTATDALSGVDATYYSIDGGDPVLYTGVFDFDKRGTHTLEYWSVDRAGNVEAKASKTIKIDDVPPTITAAKAPAPTKYGWNNGPVTAHFDCADAESGIAGCENDYVFKNEGANQSFTGTAVDNAGNKASVLVDGVNIDLTPPTLSGKATTDPNAAGWYNGDVTIHWTAADGLAGIDPDSVPADSTITGEGDNLGAGPVTVMDKAGNSQSASIRGIKIDRTPPTITPSKPDPNAAGWYRGAVTVSYTCADNLSGVASCPDKQVLTGDGAGQSVTSGTATDVAGNVAGGKTTSGINIDSQAPQSTAAIQCTKVNDWCSGDTATVVISATDQLGLSGVKEIHYSVNGGAEQVAAGASASVNVPLSGTGTASVSFYAVDNAGNAELSNAVSLKWDNIAPKVTHALDPLANAAGWNLSNTTIHFSATDELGGSGVDPTTVTPDQTVNVETAGQTVNGEAKDYAGNKGTDSVVVRLDKTPPTIGGAPTTQPNANGWYNGAVTVHFSCADNLSGIASCPQDATLTGNGSGQQLTGTATDKAGNSTVAIVSGINIDTTKPTIAFTGVSGGGIYTLGSVPTAGCTATDSGSGLTAPCSVTVTGGSGNGVGTYTVSATVSDKAGNSATSSISYRVIYRWDGFLQPINDTAHQVGVSTSIFKGGSTVPTKFQLKRADGTIVQANTLPLWLAPAKGSSTSAPVSESLYSDPAASGSTYAWDPSGQQYQYNWSTKGYASGYYWRIGVQLDDGQIYGVNLGLR